MRSEEIRLYLIIYQEWFGGDHEGGGLEEFSQMGLVPVLAVTPNKVSWELPVSSSTKWIIK